MGMEISNSLNNFENTANTIVNKVKTEINKWYRFRLSLPGRIAVTKSLVYSQLSYLGSFLPFTGEQIKKMSEPIEQFVSGNLNIAKARIYATTKKWRVRTGRYQHLSKLPKMWVDKT